MLRFADGNKTPRVAPESYTEYCGQAPSATLYIREVLGSNPGRCGFFFRGFPTPSHRGMSHITDKANAGSVSTSAGTTTFLPRPSTPYPPRIFPSMWLKRLWKASAARSPLKDVSLPSFIRNQFWDYPTSD
jgi:hypothetical protein